MPLSRPQCRVLIVDSSFEVLALMTNLFRPYGFDLIVASTAGDAVRLATECRPHAVYMGLEYDDCNGWELAERLRKVKGTKRAMLVGLIDRRTGCQSEVEHGSYGFDHYFPKPPRMRDIIEVIFDKMAFITRDGGLGH